MQEKLELIDVHVAAIYYYLYRQAGCPLGNNISGYAAWVELVADSFATLEDEIVEEDIVDS